MADDTPELLVPDGPGWRDWLRKHHAEPQGVRLVLARKAAVQPVTELRYDEALEEALCQGWIDGQLTQRDKSTYRVRFTPRRARSPWSARNVGIAERLIEEGRMQPAGLVEIERAKADGRWAAAYRGSASMDVPADLQAALDAEPRAMAMWDLLTRRNRYAILYRVQDAKRAETRVRRIETFVRMLAAGETPYPQKQRPGQR